MLAQQEEMALRKEAEALAAEKRSAMIEEARAMKVNTRASLGGSQARATEECLERWRARRLNTARARPRKLREVEPAKRESKNAGGFHTRCVAGVDAQAEKDALREKEEPPPAASGGLAALAARAPSGGSRASGLAGAFGGDRGDRGAAGAGGLPAGGRFGNLRDDKPRDAPRTQGFERRDGGGDSRGGDSRGGGGDSGGRWR
jgi:hypothetical protein